MSIRILRSTTIRAPAERVFELLTHPDHIHEVNPDITVTAHRASAAGGFDMDWEYRLAGITLNGQSTVIEFARPDRVVLATAGGVPSQWTWSLMACAQGTSLDLELEYTVPQALAFLGKILERQNEKAVDAQIENLTRLAESTAHG